MNANIDLGGSTRMNVGMTLMNANIDLGEHATMNVGMSSLNAGTANEVILYIRNPHFYTCKRNLFNRHFKHGNLEMIVTAL